MPIARIQTEDGRIARFEVPEGMSDSDVEKYAAEALKSSPTVNSQPLPEPKEMPISAVDAGLSSGINAVPFGADIAASFEALKNGDPQKSFGENQSAAKAILTDAIRRGENQHPYASGAGTIAGTAATIPLIPARALSGASVAARAMKGAGLGAVLGGLHGAGEGNGLDERAANSITGAVLGAPFGVGGALLSDAVGAGVMASRGLAKRAANLVKNSVARNSGAAESNAAGVGAAANNIAGEAGQVGGSDTLGTLKQALNSAPKIEPPTGEIIPLTKGQATQNPRLQALESGAAAGVHGDEAQRLINEARVLQSEKAKEAVSNIAGAEITPETALTSMGGVIDRLRSSYKDAKLKTSAAYKNLGELAQKEPVEISSSYVNNGMIPAFKEWAEKGSNGLAWDLEAKGMENAKRLYDKAQIFTKNSETSSSLTKNFFDMENWRSAVSQGIKDATTPSERTFLGGLLQRYDTAMQQLPREAIKSGDEAVLSAMERARSSRKEQGIRFERSKLVKDIVQNENITNEQFANSILSLGPKAGSYVRDIVNAAGKDPVAQAELQKQIKQSVLASIVNKSLSAELKEGGTVAGGVENMISFDKLTTNLSKLMKNRTLFERVVPDAAEREIIQKIYNASSLIKSMKPGTKNYSNTAYTIFNLIQSTSPSLASANVGGIGLGKALSSAGKAGALNELNQSIAPVLKGISDEAGTITNFGKKYGRQVMAGASSIEPNTQTDTVARPPHITIRPRGSYNPSFSYQEAN